LHRLHQNLAYRKARIERGIRILENDLDPALSADGMLCPHRQNILAFVPGLTTRGLMQAHQRQSDRGFAGAGFADHAQRFATGEFERDILDSAYGFAAEQPSGT
jgi:hypothetical protein